MQWRARRAVILKGVEGGLPVLVERDHLAVDDRFIRHGCERLDDARIATAEIVIVTRSQLHLAAALNRQGSVSVELNLIYPVRPLGQLLHAQKQHWFDEGGPHFRLCHN